MDQGRVAKRRRRRWMSQNNRLLFPNANTFVGAYDAIPSIAAAYSTRRLLTSYTGPLLRLVADRTGYPEQDIGATAAGDLDTAAAASFLAGDTGYVTKWYDQGVTAYHITQATLAKMPLYVASGQNSKPVLDFQGTSTLSVANFAALVNTQYSVSLAGTSPASPGVIATTGTNANALFVPRWTTGNMRFIHRQPEAGSGGDEVNTMAMTNGAFEITSAVRAAASMSTWRNGGNSATNSSLTTSLFSETTLALYIGSNRDTGYYWAEDMAELVFCSASTSRAAVETAMNAYWSIY